MRKVTASAVILTAITGCSQSEVPSSSWSFDAPAGQQLAGQNGENDADQANLFASDSRALFDQSSLSSLGSTFGELDEDTVLRSDALASTDLFAQGLSPDISAVVSTRVDPLASVRSYLEATRSVSDISNRVPYSSQVYLPDAPVYSPTVVSAEDIVAWQPSQVTSFPSDVAIDAASAVADLAQVSPGTFPVQSQPDAFLTASAVTTPQAFISTEPVSAETVSAETLSAETLSAAEERYLSESYIEESQPTQLAAFQDSLPVLEPAQPERSWVSSTPSADSAVSVSRSVSDAPVSVGTAILQTLAQNGDSEALEVLSTADVERGSVEISIDEDLGDELSDVPMAEARPTLSGLLASMPQREDTPLVTSFEVVPRDAQRISRLSGEASLTDVPAEALPAETLPAETLPTERLAVPSDRSIPVFRPQSRNLPLPVGLLRDLSAEGPAEAMPVESALFESEAVNPESLESESVESASVKPQLVESQLVESQLVVPVSREALQSELVPGAAEPFADAPEYIRPSGYSSPLLESLAVAQQSSVALSAVYVPIPDAAATDVTAAYIREAIASLDTDANRVDSVASAQRLESPTATLVRFSDASRSIGMVIEREASAAQKYAHLRKLPPQAANRSQLIRPRQRLVWQ